MLVGTIVAAPERRHTPADTPVAVFRLRVPPSPDEAAVSGCVVPVVAFGEEAASVEAAEGQEVEIEGALTERRWRGASGVRQSRFEILARTVRLL